MEQVTTRKAVGASGAGGGCLETTRTWAVVVHSLPAKVDMYRVKPCNQLHAKVVLVKAAETPTQDVPLLAATVLTTQEAAVTTWVPQTVQMSMCKIKLEKTTKFVSTERCSWINPSTSHECRQHWSHRLPPLIKSYLIWMIFGLMIIFLRTDGYMHIPAQPAAYWSRIASNGVLVLVALFPEAGCPMRSPPPPQQ